MSANGDWESLGCDRRVLRQAQEERLRELIRYVAPANPFYSRQWRQAGVDPNSIRTLDDLHRLPLTTKAEIVADQRDHPPYGTNLTYPLERYSRLHQTSATTGQPLRWLDTPESWEWFLRCWRVIYDIIGVRAEDRLFFPFSFGPFIGFWGAFEAAARRGNLCLPAGGMSSRARLQFLLDNQVTIVACTPTYALRLAEVAEQEGIDLAASPVRALIVAGEPGGSIPSTRSRMETAWGARVFDHTGMTEIGATGVECPPGPGAVHILETEFIPEIIDPDTTQPVSAGRDGELVLTNLGRWGSPLIRYRTGDLVRAAAEPCPCGRVWIRLDGGILGRIDEMLLVRGNNVYPSAVEEILRRFGEVAEFRIELVSRGPMPQVSIEVEPTTHEAPSHPLATLAERISQAIGDSLFFRPEVHVVPPGTLPRFEMKAKRWVHGQSE